MSEALTPTSAPQWNDWVVNFDKAYKQFNDNYNALLSQAPYLTLHHPGLLVDYYRLVLRYQQMLDTVNQLKAQRDMVAGWLNSIGQFFTNMTPDNFVRGSVVIGNSISNTVQSGLDWLKGAFGMSEYDANRSYLGSLGIAPVVVIVGIGAATAALIALASLAKDTYEFAQRVEAIKDLEAKGMSPDAAAATVNGVLGAPASGNTVFGIDTNMLMLTAAAVLLGPPLIAALNKRGAT